MGRDRQVALARLPSTRARVSASIATPVIIAALAVTACSRGTTGPDEPTTTPAAPVTVKLGAVDAEVGAVLEPLLAAARKEPNEGEHRGTLGMALEVNGFAAAAQESYRQAAVLAPSDARWPYYGALLLAGRGELPEALELLVRSIELDPGHVPAWMWRGSWLLDLNRVDEAAAAFKEAIVRGGGVPAQLGLARATLRRGDARGALALLDPLMAEDVHPHTLKLARQAHRQLGSADEAHPAFAAVTETGPLQWPDSRSAAKKAYEASIGARIANVRTLLADGALEQALRAAQTLYQRYPDHQSVLTVLGESYRRLGRREEEYGVLIRGVDLYPNFYSYHLKLAEYHLASGDGGSAFRHLDRVIELNPDVGWAHAQRGLLLLEGDRLDEALESFETALGLDPQAAVYYYAGMTEASRRDWAAAIEHFTGATEADPSFTLGHVGLGRSLAEVGRFDDARSALRRAHEIGSHPAEVGAALAWFERRVEGSP